VLKISIRIERVGCQLGWNVERAVGPGLKTCVGVS